MQHSPPEGAQNHKTKGAMRKLRIAKLYWVVGAARLGAAHPTGGNPPKNDLIALHSAGQVCQGDLRRGRALTVIAPFL